MRQVFSSLRIENVEGIAKMLEDEGIEVRITHGRSYKGGWAGRRSYQEAEKGGPLPAVWVVKSEDQPRARQLLRDAGLLDTTRGGSDSFLPEVGLQTIGGATPTPTKRAFRWKMGLIIAIVIAVGMAWVATHRASKTPAPQVATTQPTKPAVAQTVAAAPVDPVPGAYPVETPPALATMLVGVELANDPVKSACVQIDGKQAEAALPTGTTLDCKTPPLTIDVRNWRTDGSGLGTVELAVTSGRSTQVRTLLVRRIEADWRVIRVLSVR